MANRFWIGNSGSWDDPTNWSTTSGGTGGAAVPTAADDVFFDAHSFPVTFAPLVSLASNASCHNFTALNSIPNFPTLDGSSIHHYHLAVYGSFAWNYGGTSNLTPNNMYIDFLSTSAQTVSAGNSFGFVLFNFDGVGGQWTVSGTFACITLNLTNGTLILQSGQLYTLDALTTSGSNIKTLRATTPGTQAQIFITTSNPAPAVSFIDVQDNFAQNEIPFKDTGGVNSGNNTNWSFIGTVSDNSLFFAS